MSEPKKKAAGCVLVVDDEPHVVTYLEMLLQDEGYETCSAENGREAMERVRERRPDLICLDVTMPKETGARFYKNLMGDPGLAGIPVLVVTATVGADSGEGPFGEFLESHREFPPPAGCFSKPIDREEFLARVRELVPLETGAG